MPNTSFELSGDTSAERGSFTVAIVGPDYTGSTNWNTVGNIIKGDATGVSKTISVSGGDWDALFGGLVTEGYYTVLIYDGSYYLLGTGTLWVTFKG